ncbi:hypothetical protein K1719_044653 [Acacia pycnantha]|nr:hypothetical protein K1719_044653 [Acacia pycnantha]
MDGVSSIKNIEFARHLSCRPFKLHYGMFAKEAIKAGLKGYEAKRALATATEATSREQVAASTMATDLKDLW